jgi:hypothetical protein
MGEKEIMPGLMHDPRPIGRRVGPVGRRKAGDRRRRAHPARLRQIAVITVIHRMSNHPRIKSSTLRTICTQAGIGRGEFVEAYEAV